MTRGHQISSLRVLHVITDRDRRGAQVFAADLASGLGVLGASNTVVALAPGRHGDLLLLDHLGPARRSPETLSKLRALARSHDVVVAHGSATLLACSVALLGTRVPFVYRQISDPLHWAASAPRRVRVALLLRRAAAIVSLSESVAEILRGHYWLRTRPITVLPNAVPGDPFRPATPTERRAARSTFDLPPDVPVALFMGALATEKGADLVVNAVGGAPDAFLLVVGDGPERERLETLARRVVPGRVRFAGSIDDPLRAFHAADMLVLASRGGDSMPAVLIEAGLCGLPAVSTPVGAITDVVVDGDTGIVVDIDDQVTLSGCVQRLLMDGQLRAALGAAAQRRCSANFTIETTAPAWGSLLTDTARRPRRARAFSRLQHRV